MRLLRRETGQSAARGCQVEFDENGRVPDITAPREVARAVRRSGPSPDTCLLAPDVLFQGRLFAVHGPFYDGRVGHGSS